MDYMFRALRADEIELRIGTTSVGKGVSLLLYKDARCDMNILDETVGAMNWQREHYEVKGKDFCKVGIQDAKTNEWVWKSDCGVESNTEKEKGEASDAFKRACFNWGIGRELYTAPFIWISLKPEHFDEKSQKLKRATSNYIAGFKVADIKYNEKREITSILIVNSEGKAVWRL